MTVGTTKINRETDVLENQIQLDGDLDALNTSTPPGQYMTATANALSLLFTDRSLSKSCHGETWRRRSKVPKKLRSLSHLRPPICMSSLGKQAERGQC